MSKLSCVSKRITINTQRGELPLTLFKPEAADKPASKTFGLLWLHGGGYKKGSASQVRFGRAADIVKKHGAVVIAPDYTLSEKAPYPAALLDAYSALCFMKKNADKLGFSDDLIAVGGESAGGGLAAGLCLYVRDKARAEGKDSIGIKFQMTLCPMLDDRKRDFPKGTGDIAWGVKRNEKAWRLYLGELYGGDVPPYAAPARATDLSDLPSAYGYVGNTEVFYEETVSYYKRLKEAGVDAVLDVYDDIFHCHDLIFPAGPKGKLIKENVEKNWIIQTEKILEGR